MEITESRIVRIENKVVTLKDLRTLATIMLQAAADFQPDSWTITFSVSCFDESKFTSERVDLFDDNSVLAPKRVRDVRMKAYSYSDGAEIDINISHGSNSNSYSNRIEITGRNNNWVNAYLVKLEESLNTFSPQNNFFTDNRYKLNILIATGLGLVYLYFLALIPSEPPQDPPKWAVFVAELFKEYSLLEHAFKYAASLIAGWFPGLFIIDKLQKLWPTIELQIGPEHMLIEKSRRKWLSGVCLIAIAPLCTSVIYDFVKYITLANGS